MLAENDVMEMTKRGVPGVWTYGFYDGWVPNYMFFIAHSHNAIGRFYEVQSYGPDPVHGHARRRRPRARSGSGRTRRCRRSSGGPRNNTNIQESALLFSLSHVAKNKELYLENYWLKNKRAVDKGEDRPDLRVGDPGGAAPQGRRGAGRQRAPRAGARDFDGATAAFKAGGVDVKAGRLHRPRRSAVPHACRHVLLDPELRAAESVAVRRHRLDVPVHARPRRSCRSRTKGILDQQMTLADGGCEGAGGIEGTRSASSSSSTPATTTSSRSGSQNADVKMLAAEDDFELGGHKFRAGAIIVPERRPRAARADAEGAGPVGVGGGVGAGGEDARSRRAAHRLRPQLDADAGRRLVARGARHVRRARTPTSRDQKLREGNLRSKYDVIIFPHVGGSAVSQVNGMPEDRRRAAAVQEDRRSFRTWRSSTRATTSAAAWAIEGLVELVKFVQAGRHADHRRIDGDDLPRVRHHRRRHRRGAGAAVRARVDPARADLPT